MRLVEFGAESEVYIFASVAGVVVCSFCAFTRDGRGPDFETRDLDDMRAHVRAHAAAGHRVPGWLDEHLRSEWRSLPWMEGARR